MPVKPQLLAPVTADGDNGGMPSELWQRLRAAREHAKLTQQQIADACGVSREAVSQWEAKDPAKRKTPGVPRLRIVSRLTSAPLDWLLDDGRDVEPGWEHVIAAPDDPGAPAPQKISGKATFFTALAITAALIFIIFRFPELAKLLS